MNDLVWNFIPAFVRAGLRTLLLATSGLLAWGCGGDSGIDIGSGQSVDPVVVDYPLFYVKRPLPLDDSGEIIQTDFREILRVDFGADLYMRDRASASAPEINLTASETGGFGDVRDVSISHDGERVLFSMRAPIDPDGDPVDQPTWNIWEYSIPDRSLRRIMDEIISAEEGHDIGAHYLPDGRILFSSTRQNQSVGMLPNQDKPQFSALHEGLNEVEEEPAFVLHVMNDVGGDIEQISFNQSHDLYPSVLNNGRIMYSRWDAMGGQNAVSLYSANPDGTGLQLLYGADSHATGTFDPAAGSNSIVQFIEPKELPDGRVLALLAPYSGITGGGDLVIIDTAAYINNTQPNLLNAGALGPGQQRASSRVVSTIPGISTGGRFTAAWPLWDGTNRMLVSWAICRLRIEPPLFDPLVDPVPPIELCTPDNLADPQAIDAEPAYGIWVYDFSVDTFRPVILAEPGFVLTDIAVSQPRVRPTVILDQDDSGLADPVLASEGTGLLHIRSVYDIDGVDVFDYATLADPGQTTADARPARFIRIYSAVGIPDEETLDFSNSAFGVSRALGMREIIGYAPVEPDGSVMVKVPADVPLSIDVLDAQGHRLFTFFPRHQNWLQVRPGEVVECHGCHDPSVAGVSHGRGDSFNAVNAGAPIDGYIFPNTNLGTSADMGETMAANRVRFSCISDCGARDLTLDLVYEDVWTAAPIPLSPPVSYRLGYDGIDGAGGLVSEIPERANCVPWTADCRVIINYETHIQPLWEIARPVIDPDPAAIDRCVDCHALRDAAGAFIDPDTGRGQLELTSNPSTADANQFTSYRELLAGDNLEAIIDGTVQEVLLFQGNFDINGIPIDEPVGIGSPLSIAGANARQAFFDRFIDPGTHQGWLSEAELHLIAEWLDLGGQYFNNPFHDDVPLN